MKVLVVGGGISGMHAALRLLQKGHKVILAEKQRGTIDKVCGEGLLPFGTALLEELGLGTDLRECGRAFRGITYHHGERSIRGDFGTNVYGIGIERGKLDHLLRSACCDHPNFELRSPWHVRSEELSGFDRVLAADGVHSQLARSVGRKRTAAARLGVRFRLKTPPPPRVQVTFFPVGEVYLTPTGSQNLSVAMLLNRARLPVSGRHLGDWCRTFFKQHFPDYRDLTIEDLATRGPIAARWRGRPGNIHLLGDALQTFDPITGAGMSFGLLCGKLAAETLDDPRVYYRRIKPAMRSVGAFTSLVLALSGGGLRTKLMMRQLGRSPEVFNRILTLHDGAHLPTDLPLADVFSLLRV